MHLSTFLLSLALAGINAASALPVSVQTRDCAYPTFKLVNFLYGEWASDQYVQMYGDEFWFHTNDSSQATLFTLDTTTSQLWSPNIGVAYWLGLVPGHDAAIRYATPETVSSTSGAIVLNCTVVTSDGDSPSGDIANGDLLSCSGDDTDQNKQFNMCWGAGGGQGLTLSLGNSTGPYDEPRYIPNWLYCGGLAVKIDSLDCGTAPV